MGMETFAVVFVTDATIHSLFVQRGNRRNNIMLNPQGWARFVKFETWHPGRDYEIPTLMGRQDQEADAPYRISFVLTRDASATIPPTVIPLQQCVRQTAESRGMMTSHAEPVGLENQLTWSVSLNRPPSRNN